MVFLIVFCQLSIEKIKFFHTFFFKEQKIFLNATLTDRKIFRFSLINSLASKSTGLPYGNNTKPSLQKSFKFQTVKAVITTFSIFFSNYILISISVTLVTLIKLFMKQEETTNSIARKDTFQLD